VAKANLNKVPAPSVAAFKGFKSASAITCACVETGQSLYCVDVKLVA
jgi:hypothetical protein